MEEVELTGFSLRPATGQRKEAKMTDVSCPGYLAVQSVLLTDRNPGGEAGLGRKTMVEVMEKVTFRGCYSSRYLGRGRGFRAEGQPRSPKGVTSSTWPRLPEYFRG